MLASGTPGSGVPRAGGTRLQKEKVTTRLAAPLRRRLKVYAAAAGLTVEDVVSTALDNYLSAVPAEVALVMASSGQSEAAPAL
jgi:hypothetical protein